MNILIIGTTDILGGAAKISWTLKDYLQKNGHEVSMFVADKRSNDPKVKIIPRQMWRKYLNFLLAIDDLISTDWILQTEEFKNADIIHCHNLHGRFFNLSTLQKMSKIKPVIWTLHDEWAITPHCAYTLEGSKVKDGLYACPSKDLSPRILWNNTKYLTARKNKIYKESRLHIVTPSLWLKERVRNSSLRNHDVRHIPNGIDTDIFKKTSKKGARQKLALPNDKKIILFLANDARDNPWKGWKYSEEIIKKLNERTAGPGSGDNLLFLSVGNDKKHADELNIKYIGQINNKEILASYYNAADILLFTSIAENFPLVVLEALSSGLPVASFKVGGVDEAVIHKETGYVSSYLNTEELASGVEWLLSLPDDELETMSGKASSLIKERYDQSKMIEEYLNLYHELSEGK